MKKIFVIIIIFTGCSVFGQKKPLSIKTNNFSILNDTIQIDTLSINPYYFKVYNAKNQEIDTIFYKVDFKKAQLFLSKEIIEYTDAINVEYLPYPEFLTKTYSAFDKNLIVPRKTDDAILYSFQEKNKNDDLSLFDGLYTSGSLSRGLTMGNNQDAVVNSNFNLQIEGKLAKNVSIRASITDNEVPLQEGGYSQRLNEFDKVFIELFSKNWSLKAGDIDLNNKNSYFMNFQKKISGIMVNANLEKNNTKTHIFGSGALVRGRYNRYNFNGRDGNQGPYKILGPNNELFIFIVSGSERIFSNGVLLKRGENFDYTIDYNTAEIIFTTIYPVNSNMRITVEYQIAENNYTRFLTYDGVEFDSEKLKVGLKYYNETDAKNKPIRQDLTDNQKQILAEAGDDKSQMISPSVVPTEYSENKVLYRIDSSGNDPIFVYSNDPTEDLYQVGFSYVGNNNGNYMIKTTLASGRVYEYVVPLNELKQGNYVSAIQLVAPEKKQLFSLNAAYAPNEKTDVKSEVTFSNYDQNLFSNLDDANNNGFAAKLNWNQLLIDKASKLSGNIDFEYINENFETIERFRNVEFSRDWNIENIFKIDREKQLLFKGGLNYLIDSSSAIRYQFEKLDLGDTYAGIRNSLYAKLNFKKTQIYADGSMMSNEEFNEKNDFFRWYSTVIQEYRKSWFGVKFNYENNQRKDAITNNLNARSYKFTELEGFVGIGDSTKIFAEIGYNYKSADSLNISSLHTVNKVNTYFLKTQLVKNKNTNLSLYINYKNIKNLNSEDEEVLNSRIVYSQNIFKKFIGLQTLYETQSGNLPQQEFTYVEVEPGKGFYEWIDFNENGIQELDEFVIARFQDQAKYVRVLLPSINFIKTNKNRFSQSVNINAKQWQSEEGWKKAASHFNNHIYFLTDINSRRDDSSFNLNPFEIDESNLLNLDTSFKNSLFYNRGLQKFSMAYTFVKLRKRTIFVFGDQDVQLKSHQFQFIHKLGNYWLIDLRGGFKDNTSKSNSYQNRNYKLNTFDLTPQISYLYSKNSRLELFYKYKNKENQIEDFETLFMHVFGANFQYSNKGKFSVNANVNMVLNDFTGNTNSPVAFQMLEGLQPGTNFTWMLNLQKRLTSFLDLNFNYSGRKSESSKTIHTGTVQLRATF